ncbi:putative disease resistance protein [Sesamum alatum]|uniref:Disease resistance protein n=1 Tax=Sesamum alatum TaxID=300844 RepID=A0AAE1Y844_9LAMI|nr:putative disease resistance protein [Sesamum alatum]
MATVSAVRAVSERLDYLLLGEGAPTRCVGDLRDRVVQLQSELGAIEHFLNEADGRTSTSTGDFTKAVTQLVYEIEDAVESYAHRQEPRKSGGAFRCLSEWRFTASDLEADLQVFKRRIDELKHFMAAESTEPAAGSSSSFPTVQPQHMNQQQLSANTIVGMEDERARLKSILQGGEYRLSAVAIWGMGGIGKTTLAKSLYNDPLLVKYFDNRVWATVSQEFQARDLLETMLCCLASGLSKDQIARMETMELMEQIYKAQKGRRYLVVLDDVWSTEAWETLRFAFPDDNNGSRILITTRLRDVAENITTFVLKIGLLSEEDGWRLLKSLLGKEVLEPDLEEIAKEIARHCKGLPLAITVISGLMRRMTPDDWKTILPMLQTQTVDVETKNLLNIIALSYKSLPCHLKPCLLSLGYFPSDQHIPVDKLYLLWMAEGLISMRALNNKASMEVAGYYLSQLVNRNLVMLAEKEELSASRRIKSCQVHDVIRDLCVSTGKQEEFFQVIDFQPGNEISSLPRRVSIYLDQFEYRNDVSTNIPDAKNVRTILFFDTDNSPPKPTWPTAFSELDSFQWTRVLDFDGVDFRVRKLPSGIEKLFYLRYLSFRGCYLPELPSYLSNFPFLETLDLRVRVSCVMTIPNVLWKLSRLRHLFFPLAFQSNTKDKLKLDTLKELETLENFDAGICDTQDLLQLENLQILTGTVEGNNVLLNHIISSMNRVKLLGCCSLVVKSFDSYSKERLSIVAALLECNALYALDIEAYLGELPLHDVRFSSSFTELVFNGSEFKEDPMPVLGKLPSLRSLVLCNDAFVGKKMVCHQLDFPKLTSLKLASLQLLEELEVETGAMPNLTILMVEQCDKLEMLPIEFADIVTLQKLMIGSMPEEFKNKVKELIEEIRDLGNFELTVTFYDC